MPPKAPEWAANREQLWNKVESVERRKDAQLARDFVISLPHELSHDQRRALVNEFLGRHFVERGYVCDVAYHLPHGKGDDRNHHAHVMVPMRAIDEEGFSLRKERPEGNPVSAWKQELAHLREDWAATTNRHLEAAGVSERVSHLSLEDRGINRMPEPKQGPLATQIEREGRESHAGNDRRRVQAENVEREEIEAELSSVVSLAEEAMKRGKMAFMTEKERKEAQDREREGWMQLSRDEKRAALKREKEAEAEEAKKHEHENQAKRERSWREGDITDYRTRYSIALAKCYDIKDPYASLADTAQAEGASFAKEQEDLRRQAALEKDPTKRQEIDLRRKIEASEYMSATHLRLAGISAAIAGKEDASQAEIDRGRAAAYDKFAEDFRKERVALQEAQEQKERDPTGQAGPAGQQKEGGAKERSDKSAETTDRKAEVNDSKAAKMARHEAAGRKAEREEQELDQDNTRQYH